MFAYPYSRLDDDILQVGSLNFQGVLGYIMQADESAPIFLAALVAPTDILTSVTVVSAMGPIPILNSRLFGGVILTAGWPDLAAE